MADDTAGSGTVAGKEPKRLGDMDAEAFRNHGHALVDWIADYLNHTERYPVLSKNPPGAVRDALPPSPPDKGVPFDAIFRDFERVILPASRTGTTRASSPTSPSRAPPPGCSPSSSPPP